MMTPFSGVHGMKAITFQDVERLSYETVADPVIEAHSDVIIEIELAGICGSDLHPYHGREVGIETGTVMGHEYIGRVVEVGREVHDLEIGDRVVGPFTTNCGRCFYCQAGLPCRCVEGEALRLARGW